ncbi:MAG: 3-deoxy-manno-octulosonate cytidylyltransferase [Acidobacteriota bacterium]
MTLTETSVLAVIPARYHSSRLPGKVLLDIGGRPMIEHVYRRASAATSIDLLLVATDDERVARVVEGFGGIACMTSEAHRSGTDRIAEIASKLPCGVIVNVQGDEPLLAPSVIDLAVKPLLADSSIRMATAARRVSEPSEWQNPHMVKVVCARDGSALYFSRAPIPYTPGDGNATAARIHVGLYVYRRDTLLTLASLPPGPLEKAESLEQLRALEHGIGIHVVDTDYISQEVNTETDLRRVTQAMAALGPNLIATHRTGHETS